MVEARGDDFKKQMSTKEYEYSWHFSFETKPDHHSMSENPFSMIICDL